MILCDRVLVWCACCVRICTQELVKVYGRQRNIMDMVMYGWHANFEGQQRLAAA